MIQSFSTTIFIQISFYATTAALLSQQKHLLISLLCLEGIILSLVLYIPCLIYIINLILPTISIILLTFGACEARLGLRIIVLISRSYGSDILKSLTTNKC
jgi:NADH-ubiquinone oxidoreductase chain 4L